MNKKYIVIIFFMSILIFIGTVYGKSFSSYKKYIINTKTLPVTLSYNMRLFKQNIRIDMSSNDLKCKQYIEHGFIKNKILSNGKFIKLHEVNKVKSGQVINIKVFSNKILDNCNIRLEIDDPYGDYKQFLLTMVFPPLVILYLLFKSTWLFVAKKLKPLFNKGSS